MEEYTNNETIIGEEENETFEPRFFDSTGATANRRRIKILQQVGDEMIVEITNETDPNKRGTALTAEIMNEFEKRIFDAEKTAAIAKENSIEAQAKAEEAKISAAEKKGTMVYAGGELKTTVNLDEKADKETTNQALENLSNSKADKQATNQAISELSEQLGNANGNISNLSEKPVLNEVTYANNTFSTEKNFKANDIIVSGKITLE